MAGNDTSDPLYLCNRRKLREIIKKYSNPIQDPTEPDEVLILGKGVSQAIREKSNQRDKEYKEAIIKWQEFLQKYENRLKTDFTAVREKRRFVDLVYHGIPEAFRIKFWFFLLGLHDNQDERRKKYSDIKRESKKYAKLEDVFQIDKDVQRTFRDRAEFKKDCSQRQCMLFNVLMAYSFYNDTLGYCQGMHQCAGLLLLYLPDEQSAFWGLHKLMTARRYQLHGMFLDEFPKYIRLREEYEKILRKKNKNLYNHLLDTYAVTDTYLMLWYFTVFQADFPLSLSLRIWDIFLLQGDIIFLPMAYTLITFKEKELKKQESPKNYITNFKTILLYEESNVIEAFKRNFRTMAQSTKSQLRIEAPEGEIPKSFGLLLDRKDLVSNGFEDEELPETVDTKQQENEHLFKRAQETASFPKPNRLSIFHYSPSGSPSPPSDIRHRAFSDGSSNNRIDLLDNPVMNYNDKASTNHSNKFGNSSVCSFETKSAGSEFENFERSSEIGDSKSENNMPALCSPLSDSDAEVKIVTGASSSNVSEELSPVSEPIGGIVYGKTETSNIQSVRLIKKVDRISDQFQGRPSTSENAKKSKVVHIRPHSSALNKDEIELILKKRTDSSLPSTEENKDAGSLISPVDSAANGGPVALSHLNSAPTSSGMQQQKNRIATRNSFSFNVPAESHIPVITPYSNRAVEFKNFSAIRPVSCSSSMLPVLDTRTYTSSPIALPDSKGSARYSTMSASGTDTRRSFVSSSSRSPTSKSKSKSFLLTNSLLDNGGGSLGRTSRMRVDVNRNSWGENAVNSTSTVSKRYSNVSNYQSILRNQNNQAHHLIGTATTPRRTYEKPSIQQHVPTTATNSSTGINAAQTPDISYQHRILLGNQKYETEFSANVCSAASNNSSMNAATMNGNCRGSTPNIDPRSQRSPGIYQRGQGDGIVLSKKGQPHPSDSHIASVFNQKTNTEAQSSRNERPVTIDNNEPGTSSTSRNSQPNRSKISQLNQGKVASTVSIHL